MKRITLLMQCLLTLFLQSYADNEKLWLYLGNGNFNGNPNTAPQYAPCSTMDFRITFNIPSNYSHVKQFDWYVNGVFIKSTDQYNSISEPSGYYAMTDLQVTALLNDVVCKVIYENNTAPSAPVPTPIYQVKANPPPFDGITSPGALPVGVQEATYSMLPYTGTSPFTVTWTPPPGWNIITTWNNGYYAKFAVPYDGGGLMQATANFTSGTCQFQATKTLVVLRSYPAPVFTNPGPVQVCGSSEGSITYSSFSINPDPLAGTYTWRVIPYTGSASGITFSANGQQTYTTSSPTVQIAFNTAEDQGLKLGVRTNTASGGYSPETILQIGYNTSPIQWSPYINFDPGCLQYCGGSAYIPFMASAPYVAGATYYWYVDGFLTDVVSISNTTYLAWHGPGENYLQVKATTVCGSTPLHSEPFPVSCNCPGFKATGSDAASALVYPNPGGGYEVTVELKTDAKVVLKDIKQVRVLDKFGNLKKVIKLPLGTKKARLNLAELPANIYFLELSDGVNKTNVQFSKK